MRNINVKQFAETVQQAKPDWSPDGKVLTVYKIPLDKLYYNDDNGRIATWISEYLNNNGNDALDNINHEQFNKLIHGFVKRANSKDSFENTKNDIKIKGQIRPGVVLLDGRVVSGNRRFTILRELYEETGSDKYGYFECFIVEKNLDNDQERKEIKTIERLTQFGVDEKVDYDPIARLVDVYNDLVGPKRIWTIEEYTKKLSLKKQDVELMYNKAKVMVDYLEYIEKPNHFYLARAGKLDGPLQELARVYSKTSQPEWNNIRIVFYAQLLEKGDTTRDVRNLINIYKSDKNEFNQILNKVKGDIDLQEKKFFDSNQQKEETMLSDPIMLEKEKSNIFDSTIPEVEPIFSDATKNDIFNVTFKVKTEKNKKDKIKKVYDSLNILMLTLPDTIQLMSNEEKTRLRKQINQFNQKINLIFEE